MCVVSLSTKVRCSGLDVMYIWGISTSLAWYEVDIFEWVVAPTGLHWVAIALRKLSKKLQMCVFGCVKCVIIIDES